MTTDPKAIQAPKKGSSRSDNLRLFREVLAEISAEEAAKPFHVSEGRS